MNYKSIIRPIGMALATTLLVGCESDNGIVTPTPDNGHEIWMTVSVRNASVGTRADGNVPDWDSRVTSAIGYITEKGKRNVIAYGRPFKMPAEGVTDADITYEGTTTKILLAVSGDLEAGKEYDLYLAANIPVADQQSIIDSRYSQTGVQIATLTFSHPSSTWSNWAAASFETAHTMPMGCVEPIVIELEDTDYSRENPYHAGGEGPTRQSFTMTRGLARVDFRDDSPADTGVNEYVIENHSGALKVQFKRCQPINLNSSSYFVPTYQAVTPANTIVTCPPTQSRYPASMITLPTSRPANNAFTHLCYLPENVPAVDRVSYQTATGFIFTGILKGVEGVCDEELIAYLDGSKIVNGAHPTLYYYDDGRFQSMPMYRAVAPTGSNWRSITWSETLGGYAVSYRKAIRHGGYAGQTPAPVADDGVVSEMEYGVVRNHNYELSIGKVTALPHPAGNTDIPETNKEDIDLKITVDTNWEYHRGTTEIEIN